MPLPGTPLFRNGKLIGRVITRHDGSVWMTKAVAVKDSGVLDLTGAPGWDARYVDQVFEEGVEGGLSYVKAQVEYTIPIATFRRYAFLKENAVHGDQYHCHVKHYRSSGVSGAVESSPSLGLEDGTALHAVPARFSFGELATCPRCHGRGQWQGKECERCNGLGAVPNKGVVPWLR